LLDIDCPSISSPPLSKNIYTHQQTSNKQTNNDQLTPQPSPVLPFLRASQEPSLHVRFDVRVLSLPSPSWQRLPSFWVHPPRVLLVLVLRSRSSLLLLLVRYNIISLFAVWENENPHRSKKQALPVIHTTQKAKKSNDIFFSKSCR
jgi:hypothetical protein